jgi:hypothetical protein
MMAILAETCVPMICVAFTSNPGVNHLPGSPWGLLLLPIIALSTLRLDPFLSRFAGVSATSFYLLAAAFDGWQPALVVSHSGVTQSGVTLYAVILLGSGFAAGSVAAVIERRAETIFSEVLLRQDFERLQRCSPPLRCRRIS